MTPGHAGTDNFRSPLQSQATASLSLSPCLILLLPECPLRAIPFLAVIGIDVVIPPQLRLPLELVCIAPALLLMALAWERATPGRSVPALCAVVSLMIWASYVESRLAPYLWMGFLVIASGSIIRRRTRVAEAVIDGQTHCCGLRPAAR
jgi:hypothetical protein